MPTKKLEELSQHAEHFDKLSAEGQRITRKKTSEKMGST